MVFEIFVWVSLYKTNPGKSRNARTASWTGLRAVIKIHFPPNTMERTRDKVQPANRRLFVRVKGLQFLYKARIPAEDSIAADMVERAGPDILSFVDRN